MTPEALALDVGLPGPVGTQQHDIARLDMAGTALEVLGGHLAVVPEMRQVHDGRRAHPLIDRHGGDVAIAGQEVHGRVDVRVCMTAHGEDARLEERAAVVARAELARDQPAEVRANGEAQIDDAHGDGHGVPFGTACQRR